MSYSSWTPQEDEHLFDPLGPEGRPRGETRHGTLIGIGSGMVVGLLAAAGALWVTQGSFAFGVSAPESANARPSSTPVSTLASAGMSVTEISLLAPSGALEIDSNRIYLTARSAEGMQPVSDAAPGPQASGVKISRSMPLPPANPLSASRSLQEMDQGVSASAPLPQRNPLVRDQRLAYASLPDPSAPLSDAPSAQAPVDTPAGETEVALPTADSDYAVYDIKGRKLYMPGGDRFEAHSGYGEMMDDVRHVSRRMVGPTPPNVYSLTMRESKFHGVEAVRMNPIGTGKMYGRAGILLHPYMLGPRGDSNGCVSVKDYDKFLAAFKKGEVRRVIVVAELKNAPVEPNSLLSWLKPR